MKEYRKRFIELTLLPIGLVLLIMFAAVAVYMYNDYCDNLRTTMEQLVRPMESFKDMSGAQPPEAPPDDKNAPNGDKEAQKDIMTVFYTQSSGNISVISQTELFEETDLSGIIKSVTEQTQDFGTLHDYGVIYFKTGDGAPYKIALASTGYIRNSMISLVCVLFAIWMGAMLCVLLVSIWLSKIAVKPMDEAMKREKQFVADASHDLKTPLSVILANNSILEQNPDSTVKSMDRWIDSTHAAAKRMQALIGEMLTLADAECTDVSIEMHETDIADIATKAALQLESVAYEKNVTLETDIPQSLTIKTNADRFMRIATGLTENAIKHEPAGGEVTIKLYTVKHKTVLEVKNKLSMISAGDLPHVFDRFYRGDKSREQATGGHGLGLAITKSLAEQLGGSISASSDEQTGTVFRAEFPM